MFGLFGRVSPAQAKVVLSSHDKETNRPVKVTRILPDPNVSPFGHSLLALLFYGCFIAYIVVAALEYKYQPPATIISQIDSNDASSVPPLSVRLGVECKVEDPSSTTAPTCGDMILNVNYTNYPNSPCFAGRPISIIQEGNAQTQTLALSNGGAFNIKMQQHNTAATSSKTFYDVPLCFTAQESLNLGRVDGIDNLPFSMISVGFMALNETGILGAQMSVEVKYDGKTSPSTFAAEEQKTLNAVTTAKRIVNINSDNSVRVLPLSASIERGLKNEVISFIPSAEVIQFEGFRSGPSDAFPYRSDVGIVLQSKTILRKQESVKSLWLLVSSIGSAFETLMGFMPFLLPIWGWMFMTKKNWMSSWIVGNNNDNNNKNEQIPSPSSKKYAIRTSAVDEDRISDDSGELLNNATKNSTTNNSGTASVESLKEKEPSNPVTKIEVTSGSFSSKPNQSSGTFSI